MDGIRRVGHPSAMREFSALAVVALLIGCHDTTGAKAPVTCGSDESVLDGVCVSKHVANYVSCVRAQGATLGEERGKKLAVDVGYAGARAGAVSEAHDSLARQYSVSDQAVLAVINMCNEMARTGGPTTAGAAAVTTKTKEWHPPKAGEKKFAEVVEELGQFGTVVAKSDFGSGSPRFLCEFGEAVARAKYQSDKWVYTHMADGGAHSCKIEAPGAGDFLLYAEVNLIDKVAPGGQVYWNFGSSQDRVFWNLFLNREAVLLFGFDGSGAEPRQVLTEKSSRAAFQEKVDMSVVLRIAHAKAEVWLNGERAFGDVSVRPAAIDVIWLGAANTATVSYDNIVLVRLQ